MVADVNVPHWRKKNQDEEVRKIKIEKASRVCCVDAESKFFANN